MSITIGFDFENMNPIVSSSFDKELSMSDEEQEALSIFQKILSETIDLSKITLERRSKDYLSLIFNENDFLRFKFSPRSKWLSIRLTANDRKTNIDNPLFVTQKNKNELHWKSKVSNINELFKYKEFIISACSSFKN